MYSRPTNPTIKKDSSPQGRMIWKALQWIFFTIGAFILYTLVFHEEIGIQLLWNFLIPIAPALLVIAPGIWRNVCPMAFTTLFSNRLNWSQKKKLPAKLQKRLYTLSVILLLLIVPLRHAWLDTSGPLSALFIVSLVVTGVTLGFRYNWKSAWCNSLCPIHPVERLYGAKPISSVPNTQCISCEKCAAPCPDSTPKMNPGLIRKSNTDNLLAYIMIGGFPGFIWGWFQVQDYSNGVSWSQLFDIYFWPFVGMAVSTILFIGLSVIRKQRLHPQLISIFTALAVSTYYWYRIPALLGYGLYPGDGMLVDLSHSVPLELITIFTSLLTVFFIWWLAIRKSENYSWTIRPKYV